MDGIASTLPALTQALKVTKRAAQVGFDWPDAQAVFDKLAEETDELKIELVGGDQARIKDELGDMLFVLTNLARKLNIDPEICLKQATAKFTRRFNLVEDKLAATGRVPADTALHEMEECWRDVKRREKDG